MRVPITAKMRQGDKPVEVDAILWIGETPPNCRRGKNRRMKNRRYKREKIERRLEERGWAVGGDRRAS